MNNFEILIKYLIPEWIRNKYPNYVNFVRYIFQSLELDSNSPLGVLENFYKFIDVSQIDEITLEQYLYQYVSSFPVELAQKIDISTFIKNAKTFYSSKGSPISFNFVFNIIEGTLNLHYLYKDIFFLDDDSSTLSGTVLSNPKPIKKIHDNFLYAFYTYEIETDLDFSLYFDLIKNTVHPAGLKLFWKRLVWYGDGVLDISTIPIYLDYKRNFEILSFNSSPGGILDNVRYLASSKENGLFASGKINNYELIEDVHYETGVKMFSFHSKNILTIKEQSDMFSGVLDDYQKVLDNGDNSIFASGRDIHSVSFVYNEEIIPFIQFKTYNEEKQLNDIGYYLIGDLLNEKIGNFINGNYEEFVMNSSSEIQQY